MQQQNYLEWKILAQLVGHQGTQGQTHSNLLFARILFTIAPRLSSSNVCESEWELQRTLPKATNEKGMRQLRDMLRTKQSDF
jgi:hypothetical protein